MSGSLFKTPGNKKANVVSILLAVVSLHSGCIPTRDLKHLTLYGETKTVDRHKLRIDGVYYRFESQKGFGLTEYEDYVVSFVLYNNGTYFEMSWAKMRYDLAGTIDHSLRFFEERKAYVAENHNNWGAFKIVGDTLLIQGYNQWEGGEKRMDPFVYSSRVYNRKMKIMNDTTLLSVGGREYHLFKSNKPDSTNVFMTDKKVKEKLEKLYKARHQKDS